MSSVIVPPSLLPPRPSVSSVGASGASKTASQAAAALCARVVSQTAKGGCGLASVFCVGGSYRGLSFGLLVGLTRHPTVPTRTRMGRRQGDRGRGSPLGWGAGGRQGREEMAGARLGKGWVGERLRCAVRGAPTSPLGAGDGASAGLGKGGSGTGWGRGDCSYFASSCVRFLGGSESSCVRFLGKGTRGRGQRSFQTSRSTLLLF